MEDTSKKRKLSTDSLDDLDGTNLGNKELSNVKEYLQEVGLNAKLIDKNEKKLIKLDYSSIRQINQLKNSKSVCNSNDIDDLPSESDLSSCTTVFISKNNSFFNSNQVLSNKIDTQSLKDNKKLTSLIENNNNETEISSKKNTNKKRSFICIECGCQYFAQNELNKHMLQSHYSQKPFECSQCKMSFNDISAKRRHEKEHLGFKQFLCYICSFEFTRASNLRAHLLKVHPNNIGKSVTISKSIDNKLKFEFNIDEINSQKELNSSVKYSPLTTPTLSTTQVKSKNINNSAFNTNSKNNAIIYIKDPNNKNAEIQHMIVYVDGKPIFVKNPISQSSNNESLKKNVEINFKESLNSHTKNNSKPSPKIPYLLAAAASTAASNHRQSQQLEKFHQSQILVSQNSINCEKINLKKDSKQDQEYLHIVSMLKEKNEKLFNPLI